MYELAIQTSFTASHALLIAGEREESHSHDWKLTVEVMGADLDADGLLLDFHELERLVDRIIEPLQDADLNRTPPFDQENPSAELVALHVGRSLLAAFQDQEAVRLKAIHLTEAPGCVATYRPD